VGLGKGVIATTTLGTTKKRSQNGDREGRTSSAQNETHASGKEKRKGKFGNVIVGYTRRKRHQSTKKCGRGLWGGGDARGGIQRKGKGSKGKNAYGARGEGHLDNAKSLEVREG